MKNDKQNLIDSMKNVKELSQESVFAQREIFFVMKTLTGASKLYLVENNRIVHAFEACQLLIFSSNLEVRLI